MGFLAASGVYVATVLASLGVSLALATGGTAASVLGSVTSGITVGLLVGVGVASRIKGLPERLAGRPRWFVVPFLAPAAFVVLSVLAWVVPAIPERTAVGAGIGAAATLLVTFGVVSMARTRYARTMVRREPTAEFTWLKPNQHRRWFATGVMCFALAAVLARSYAMNGARFQRSFFWFGVLGVFAFYHAFGLRSLSTGHKKNEESSSDKTDKLTLFIRWHRFWYGGWYSDRSGSAGWSPDDFLRTVRVHDDGIAIVRELSQRFIPWASVSEVRLTDDELVVSRHGWFDLRCDRATIDDPEGVYAAIERARQR